MSKDATLKISQDGRDVALIFALANTAVNQQILQAIYAKVLGFSLEESEQHLAEIRRTTFVAISETLANYGDLDVPGLHQLLGL